MIINLVSSDNGAGLTQDMTLLESVLVPAGHDVERVDYQVPQMRRCDLAFFLELVSPHLIPYARHAIGILNLEWFQMAWGRHARRFDQVWAKGQMHMEAYRRVGWRNAHLTGFMTRDLYDPLVPREMTALHLRGRSGHKNTAAVIDAWRRHPDLPPLTIVTEDPLDTPPHIRVLGRQTDTQLAHLVNANLIHVCPSRVEGWGHYIAEGAMCGAIVVTLDASPMNEHVTRQFGELVRARNRTRQRMVWAYEASSNEIAMAVRRIAQLSPGDIAHRGQLARAHTLDRNEQFARTATALIGRLARARTTTP